MNRVRIAAALLVAVLLGAVVLLPTPAVAQTTVRLNEAVSSNETGLVDAYGDTSDWIELYNPGPAPIDLSGWGLSDDGSQPYLWVFPAGTSMLAGDFLLVHASDEPSTGGELHASFKLSSAGDQLHLTRPDGTTASSMTVPALLDDHSIGIGDGGGLRIFDSPTPASANPTGGAAGIVADVVASPARGFQTGPIAVTLSHPDPLAEIRFTTDATAPTATTGTVYSGPITVSSSTTLRAAAFRTDWITDRPVTHSYLYADQVPDEATMDPTRVDEPAERAAVIDGVLAHPAISIVTTETIGLDDRVATAVEWIDPNGGAGFQVDAGIKEVGGHSVRYPKDSWRLAFDSEWGESSLNFPVFEGFPSEGLIDPVDEFKRLTLRMGGHDTLFWGPNVVSSRATFTHHQTWMRGRWGDETMLELGHVNSHGRWVNVFFNGEYWGQYHLREHFDDHFMASYFGGDNSNYVGVNRGAVSAGSGSSWDDLVAAAGAWQSFKPLVDPIAYIDWMLISEFQGNFWDLRATQNWRGAGAATTGAGPGFIFQGSDQDITLDLVDAVTLFPGPADSWTTFLAEADPDFVTLLNDRIEVVLRGDGALTAAASSERWTRLENEVAESMHAELARWGNEGPEQVAQGPAPQYQDWQASSDYFRDVVFPARVDFTIDRLASMGLVSPLEAPVATPGPVVSGTTATIANPNATGTVYMTIDGSDPRAADGTVNADALPATPFVVDRAMVVRARVYDGTNWSPLAVVPYDPTVDPQAPLIDLPGEVVSMQGFGEQVVIIGAHPGGLPITFAANGLPPGVNLNSASGVLAGTPTAAGSWQVIMTATDGTRQTSASFDWIVEPAAAVAGLPVVLNEYNAVKGSESLADGGSDLTLGRLVGNGGDWFELLVTADGTDLRGWQVELFDREDGDLMLTDTMTFSMHASLADLAAGTLVVVAEAQLEDSGYDPIELDYRIVARSATGYSSALVAGAGNFDTNRHGFRVRLLDATGAVRSPYMGETDGFRTGANVGGDEVFARCDAPDPTVDPIDGVVIDTSNSSLGEPNVCDPTQDLSGLRRGFRGDPSCDGRVDILDALVIARHEVQLIDSAPDCAATAFGDLSLSGSDFTRDGVTNIADALMIARCSVGLVSPFCVLP